MKLTDYTTLPINSMLQTVYTLHPLEYSEALAEVVRVWAISQPFRVNAYEEVPGMLTTDYIGGTRDQHRAATRKLCEVLRDQRRAMR